MNCETITEDLQALLDNELQEERRTEIESHLHACSDCSLMVEDLKEVSNLLQKEDVPTPKLPTGAELLQRSSKYNGVFARALDWFSGMSNKARLTLLIAMATACVGIYFTATIALNSSYEYETASARTPQTIAPRQEREMGLDEANRVEGEMKRDASRRVANKPLAESEDQLAVAKEKVAGDVAGGVPAAPAPAEAVAKSSAPEATRPQATVSSDSVQKPKLNPEEFKERLIIKSAELTIETADFDTHKNRVTDLAKSNGGFLTRLQVNSLGGARAAEITIRVPSRNFENVVNEIRKFGKSLHENITGEDVTDQYLNVYDDTVSERDLQEEVKKVVESTTNTYDKINAQRQLREISRRRAALERQLQQLRDGVNLSTITLNLREEGSTSLVPGESLSIGSQVKRSFLNGFTNLLGLLLPVVLFVGENGLSIVFCSAVLYLLWLPIRKYLQNRKRYYSFSNSEMHNWMK